MTASELEKHNPDVVSEYHRIMGIQTERGDMTARFYLADEIVRLRSDLSKAKERLKEIEDKAFSEICCNVDSGLCECCEVLTKIHRLATQDEP